MNRFKGLALIMGLSTVAILAVACGNGEAATTGAPNQPAPAEAPGAPVAATKASGASVAPVAPDYASGASLAPAAPDNASPAGRASSIGVPEPASTPPAGLPEPQTSAVSLPPSSPPALPQPRNEPAQAPVTAPAPAAVGSVAVTNVAGMPVSGGTLQLQASSGQAGIWVSGQGKITLEPDLAVLNLGVEASAKSVAAAREQAATAMDAIVMSLTGNGVEGRDIQTRFFNISPQYEWTEVIQNGVRTNKQVLVGYRVSNSVAVKIRDLSAVGNIIDDVAGAGGDATRINGISFTVEDTAPFLVDLREDAVADALAKADQLARLTGVLLGRLVFISESGVGQPQARPLQEFAVVRSLAAAAPDTSISGGELVISLTVQAVFAIQ